MKRRPVLLLIAVTLWVTGIGVAAQVEKGDRNVWEGVYTGAQAARGKQRFEMSCIRCHNIALIGSERGPALKGSVFWSKWENDNLGSLFTLIRDTMPADGGAGVLSDDVKVDILAYLLQTNAYPTGSDELKLDIKALEGIKIAKKSASDGVFTAAQAERGKASFLSGRCAGCHQIDLTGERGPALKGEDFLKHWENGSVSALFTKIRETMPPNGAADVSDDAKVDIVAYLLQSNAFPAGKVDLKAEGGLLDNIEILRKGVGSGAPNFALVQVVGCLSQGPGNAWMLTRTTEPVITRDEQPTPAVLTAAQAKPLGKESFQLVSASPFKPQSQAGHKVEARGLIYRDANLARLNLTSLQSINQSCQD